MAMAQKLAHALVGESMNSTSVNASSVAHYVAVEVYRPIMLHSLKRLFLAGLAERDGMLN